MTLIGRDGCGYTWWGKNDGIYGICKARDNDVDVLKW